MPHRWKVWSVSLLLFATLSPSLPAQEALSLEARAATVISLNSRVIDTSRPEAAITEEVAEALRVRPEDSVEDEIVLVKFPGPVTARQIKALRAASLRVYAYLPYYAYLVKMPAGKRPSRASRRWARAGPAPTTRPTRSRRRVAEVVAGDLKAEAAQGDYRPVMIQVFPDATWGSRAASCATWGSRGSPARGRDPFFSRVRLLLTPAEIAAFREALAGLREVFWIDLEGAPHAAQRHHRLGRPVGPLRRADDAHLQPGDLRRGADRGASSTPASTPTCAFSATPPWACRRPTPATAARW